MAPDLNPTAASLLGYLDLGPLTGWDLDQWVRSSIGNFWNVTRSQIYRELRTLTELGYVEAGEAGRRDRVRRMRQHEAQRRADDRRPHGRVERGLRHGHFFLGRSEPLPNHSAQ